MNLRLTIAFAAVVLFAACGGAENDRELKPAAAGTAVPQAAPDAPGAVSDEPAARLNRLAEAYFEEMLKLNPLFATFIGDDRYNDHIANNIGPQHRAAEKDLNTRYLAMLGEIDAEVLEGQDRLTYLVFERDLRENIEGSRLSLIHI